MAEYEELKLVVSLDDQASGKLEPLKKNLISVGSNDVTAGFNKLKQQGVELTDVIKVLNKGFGGMADAAMLAARTAGLVGGAVIAVGVAVSRGIQAINDYAAAYSRLGTLSTRIGFDPSVFKSMIDTFERSGVPIETAEKNLAGLAHAMADISREQSQLRRHLQSGLYGQNLGNMQELIFEKLMPARRDPQKFAQIVKEAGDEIYKTVAAMPGGTPTRAAEARTNWYKEFGMDELGQVREKFDEFSQEQSDLIKRRIAEAEEYNKQIARIEQAWRKVGDALTSLGFPKLNEALTGVADRLTFVAGKFEALAEQIRNIKLPPWLEKALGFAAPAAVQAIPGLGPMKTIYDLWNKVPTGKEGEPAPAAPTPFAPGAPPLPAEPKPQAFQPFGTGRAGAAASFDERWKLQAGSPEAAAAMGRGWEHTRWDKFESGARPSTLIEDHRNLITDQNDQMKDLTGELKKLNETLSAPDEMGLAAGAGDIGGAGVPRGFRGPAGRPFRGGQRFTEPRPGAPPTIASTPQGGTPPGDVAAGGDVNEAIRSTAGMAGVDPAHWKAIASIESDLDPGSNRYAATQYKGLFQVGARGAGSEWARTGEGNIYNAMDNARSAARLAQENAAGFKKHFGRDPTTTEIYLMHQQGLGFYTRGAMTNIGGNLPPSLQRAGIRNPTHDQFEAAWGAEIEKRAAKYRTGETAPRAREAAARGPSWLDLVDPQTGSMQLDRGALYRAMQSEMTHKVEGNASIKLDVNAPAGTRVDTNYDGMFKALDMNRQMQMEPAATSQRRPQVFGPQ